MLYFLLTGLTDELSVFNVFRYHTVRTGSAILTALLFIWLCGPWIISLLKLKQGKGQPIRTDGPSRHLIEKQGTPTMGGLMILSGIMVSTLLWADLANLYVWAVLFVTLGFGAIGFYDDFLKVTKSSSHGFSGKIRLLFEFVIAHGVLELSIVIAQGAGGLMMGWALISPGNRTRSDALVIATRRAFTLLLGLAPLLVIAGTIEGNISPSDTAFAAKVTIGLTTGVLLYTYLLLGGRRPASTEGRALSAPGSVRRAPG